MLKVKKLVIANWKMNPARIQDALKLCKSTNAAARMVKNTQVIIAVPTPYIATLYKMPGKHYAFLSAQDVSYEEGGAFTGEVAGSMLFSSGATYVLVGHSERRLMGESDEQVARKMLATHKARLTPVLCVGEELRDEEGEYLKIVGEQVIQALQYLTASHIAGSVIAYEPVWAVGARATRAANPRDVEEMSLYIRRIVADRIGPNRAARVPILYGGSIEKGIAGIFMRDAGVQGLLVGRASLKVSFAKLLQEIDDA